MLAELKSAHDKLESALAELDRLAAEPTPGATLAAARLNLSRASGRRRQIVDAVTLELLAGVPEADARRVRALREANAAQLHASTTHIGAWGLRQVMADWPGYQEASARMRQSLRDLIAEDRRTLYPLLTPAA